MKLIRISIHGFKSFADKIAIDIKDGITGIVGPNGSGKSNIVDAVRWVLGEQSLKEIRGGGSGADVIFGGSKSRKPLTRGWVALTFDNSDYYLKSDLTEIEIKRVIYNTGENEYYINGEIVRLKDITELFIDSGTSVNSLSIISQGKISEIVKTSADEKIKFLEEAAGVLKYKKRKEETLRKLDKTNDNLSRINLIIDELIINLEPLKEQAEIATKYLELKENLERTEIALLAHDITEIKIDYTKNKEQKDLLTREIMLMDNLNTVDNGKVEALKLKLMKLDEDISDKSNNLYKLTNELSVLASEKQIMLERQKYQIEDVKLSSNVLNLKEKELKTTNHIMTLKDDLKKKEANLTLKIEQNNQLLNELKSLNLMKQELLNELTNLNREESIIKNKIEIINDNIDNEAKLPFPVKAVLKNQRLTGIHNIIGKLIESDEKYANAMDIALGFNANVIVVDNESSAKVAIDYLKEKAIGRATFFPLNVIKPRKVDENTLKKLNNEASFLGIAADLIKYNPIFQNIILNQLGNVIVVDNLVNANLISRKINHLYKIVTLDGDLISAGGSITGGTNKNPNGILNQKYELENLMKEVKEKEQIIKRKEEAINENNHQITSLENKIFISGNELSALKDQILRNTSEIANLEQELISITNEIKGTNGLIKGDIDKEVERTLNVYYEVSSKKEALEITVNDLKLQKNDLVAEISELEMNNKKANSDYNLKNNQLKEIEIHLGKLDIRLENFLIRLNEEYSMTYEKAATEYELATSPEEARSIVNRIKGQIKSLGEVNLGAINEFERVNTRYTFLSTQKEDLEVSIHDILKIINELDETMKERLMRTFKELNQEFGKVFNKLFRGGEAELILTNPEDILNTGMDIKAVPPGKDIKNIRLLSGGEATLTAIALLFATLNIRTVPFCILDEVESALDEANVDMFSSYLRELNTKTQFVLITHKKRTMEYTDHLYGITMQESGVSKLVSVKLN